MCIAVFGQGMSMKIKESVKNIYYKRSFRLIAGVLVVTVFVTMVLQSATLVAISRSADKSDAAVNYLAENTEYVNKSRPERIMDYLQTLGSKETLADHYQLASTQIAREEYGAALQSIEKCLSLYNNEGPDIYVDLLMKQGCLQVMLGQYDSALKNLDLALAQDPAMADIYLVKAQIYAEQQNMGGLARSLTAYLQLVPDDSSIRSLLAQAQFTQGDYDAAALQYAEIMERNPDAQTAYLLGLNAVQKSDFAAGEEQLTRAIALDDSFDGIYYYRGVCYMSLGDYSAAIEDLTVSIEKEDMQQASFYTRGVCRLMDNDYEKGLADVQFAAAGNQDEEVTKQAKLLLAELKAAETEAVPTEEAVQKLEIEAPAAVLPPGTEPEVN